MDYNSMSKEEILSSDAKAADLLAWIKQHPNEEQSDVAERFSALAAEEMRQRITAAGGSYDPNIHYDFSYKQ